MGHKCSFLYCQFVYVNSAFSPAPDEPIINLYRVSILVRGRRLESHLGQDIYHMISSIYVRGIMGSKSNTYPHVLPFPFSVLLQGDSLSFITLPQRPGDRGERERERKEIPGFLLLAFFILHVPFPPCIIPCSTSRTSQRISLPSPLYPTVSPFLHAKSSL